jgi:23S rRNA pseudouridine1911/1915/1917 synthase
MSQIIAGKYFIDILFEDNHLLVIDKPAGLLSQEDHTGEPDVLTVCKKYIKETYDKPGNVWLGLVHRLDRPVSGVMVLAKTSKAASRISDQIRKRTVIKIYHAVVSGKTPASAVWTDHLIKDSASNKSRVSNPGGDAKESSLFFSTLLYHKESDQSLVEIDLKTGRAHQIRVQFSSRNHPIAGDQKYGTSSQKKMDIALRAAEMRLDHPTLKTKMSFKASLPDSEPWAYFHEL